VDTTRVEAFSDGVFAIAITLLVLNLAVPDARAVARGDLANRLGAEWPSYAAYVVSFLIIGIIWVNHHGVFSMIARADRPLLFINLMLLMVVALIPFPTALLASYIRHGSADAHLAAAIYSANMFAMSVAFTALWLWVTREVGELLHVHIDRVRARGAVRRFSAGGAIYLVTVGLSFISAVATLAVHFAIALYYVFDQLPIATRAAPDDNP
jgi:uncharacterized membrane protein